jgi:DNA polymerase-4
MQQASRTGISPKAVREHITGLWQRTDSGRAFAEALAESGWILARGDRRDFVAIDPKGGAHSLARRIEGANAKDVRARMADLDPSRLPSAQEARAVQRGRAGEGATLDRQPPSRSAGKEAPAAGNRSGGIESSRVGDGIAKALGKALDQGLPPRQRSAPSSFLRHNLRRIAETLTRGCASSLVGPWRLGRCGSRRDDSSRAKSSSMPFRWTRGRIRKIIHIDMDAFYASVEQRDDSALKGRPVAVGYPAKRGVVAAASYEARRFGVRSAMPSTVAMRKCAELVFVPPRFEVYRAVSRQIHTVFKDYTHLVEPLSLDEAFLDVTDNLKGVSTAWETAKQIRARIRQETDLTASAGISCNKFLAKLASEYRKPNGQFAIMPDEAEAFVANLPVAKFHGVGPKTAAKMHALGIETGADLRGQTLDFLRNHFGKAGSWYFDIAHGRDDRAVQPDRERKSSGSETTFPQDLTDPARIEAGVIAMADEVWAWCEKTNSRGRTVTVKIKWANFQITTRSRSTETTIESRDRLHKVALHLIRSVLPPPRGIRLVGVSLSNFGSRTVGDATELPFRKE